MVWQNSKQRLFQIVHKIRHFLETLSNFVPWCISEKSQPKKQPKKSPLWNSCDMIFLQLYPIFLKSPLALIKMRGLVLHIKECPLIFFCSFTLPPSLEKLFLPCLLVIKLRHVNKLNILNTFSHRMLPRYITHRIEP